MTHPRGSEPPIRASGRRAVPESSAQQAISANRRRRRGVKGLRRGPRKSYRPVTTSGCADSRTIECPPRRRAGFAAAIGRSGQLRAGRFRHPARLRGPGLPRGAADVSSRALAATTIATAERGKRPRRR
eukprot:scaffold706_cov418-Prasinococcus_capsulatus_cf.AAC.42